MYLYKYTIKVNNLEYLKIEILKTEYGLITATKQGIIF